MILDRTLYPLLSQEHKFPWGPMRSQFVLGDPPADLVSNVNIVPYVGNDWLIIRTDLGWGIVGGTLEPGEHYRTTVGRELQEEAGASLGGFEVIGAFRQTSLSPTPYRPHLPHPVSYRLVGVGPVEIRAQPANPDDGEHVLQVGVFPLPKVCDLLEQRPVDGHLLAEVYRLAAEHRERRQLS